MLKDQTVKSIIALHSALTGQISSKEQKDNWNNMEIEQLHSEVNRLIEVQDFNEIYDKINEKRVQLKNAESFRILLIVLTSAIQVFGLLLINMSHYFKEYKKQKSPSIPALGSGSSGICWNNKLYAVPW